MAYEYEIKSGQRVYIENTNGHLYKATVININEYREPSMSVSLQVDGIEDIVFTGLENIKIMEDANNEKPKHQITIRQRNNTN